MLPEEKQRKRDGVDMFSSAKFSIAVVGVLVGVVALIGSMWTSTAKLTVAGSTMVCMSLMGLWVRILLRGIADTSSERADLRREAEAYGAALAVLEMERERVRRDAVESRRQARLELESDRRAMRQEFEEQRGELICQAFEAGAMAALTGALDNVPEPVATVVQLPVRAAARGLTVTGTDSRS
jgi:hypothetical protein